MERNFKTHGIQPKAAPEDIGRDAEHYEFTWAGKRRCMAEAQMPARSILLPCPQDSVGWECTRNLYIEGDNLEALRLLKQSYAGVISLIYIDPPYNTGGGFIYHDDFTGTGDRGSVHSEWLCMIAPRLLLARDLLREDGAIFLSISENELFGLKLLCDEIFGENNYMTMFSVKVRHEDRVLKADKDYHEVIEYLLMYRRSKAFRTPKRTAEADIGDYVWRVEELTHSPEAVPMGGKTVQLFRPGQYRIVRQEAGPQLLKRINIRGTLKEGNSSGRFYMQYLDGGEEKGLLFKVPGIGDDGLGFRYFLKPATDRRRNGDYFQGVPKSGGARQIPYPNYMDFERAFNRVGFEGGVEFRNGKKPVAFIEKIIDMAGLQGGDGIVLDFFAGSATTAHAVMQTNARHGGRNRYIMVQLDEDLDVAARSASGETQAAARRGIAFLDGIGKPHKLSEIGKERLRRADAQLRAGAAAAGEQPPDTGFRVFRLAETGDAEERFFHALLAYGLPLDIAYKQKTHSGICIYAAEDGAIVASFDTFIPEAALKAMADMRPRRIALCALSRTDGDMAAAQRLYELAPGMPIVTV